MALIASSIIMISTLPELLMKIDISEDKDIDNPYTSLFLIFLLWISLFSVLSTGLAWI